MSLRSCGRASPDASPPAAPVRPRQSDSVRTPDEWTADAEAHHCELINAQMIHQPELIVGMRFPRPADLDGTSRLPVWGVSEVCCDAAVFPFELLDRVEGRIAGEEADGRVQSAARKQQQREAGTGLLVVDANRASFVELARFARLLSKQVLHGGRRRGRNPRGQYAASGRIHNQRPPSAVVPVPPGTGVNSM